VVVFHLNYLGTEQVGGCVGGRGAGRGDGKGWWCYSILRLYCCCWRLSGCFKAGCPDGSQGSAVQVGWRSSGLGGRTAEWLNQVLQAQLQANCAFLHL
jgi:hypothetical protein